MTKARTKAKRRRVRANTITLPDAPSVPQRATQGRRTDREAQPADTLALATRARLTGCSVEEARDTLAGSDMGRCIRAMRPSAQERRDLLGTWQALSAAKRNHDLRIIGINPSPQSAALAMLPEAMQTDTGHSVDLRTAQERDEAARRVWQSWRDAMAALGPHHRAALEAQLDGYPAAIWDADALQPTRTGALCVMALCELHESGRS